MPTTNRHDLRTTPPAPRCPHCAAPCLWWPGDHDELAELVCPTCTRFAPADTDDGND